MWILELSPQNVVVVVAVSTMTACLALFVMARMHAGRQKNSSLRASEIAFLFKGSDLSDRSQAAQRILDATDLRGTDLARVAGFFAPRFPTLMEALVAKNAPERQDLTSIDGHSILQIDRNGKMLRLAVEDILSTDTPHEDTGTDGQIYAAMTDELRMHRGLVDAMTFPMWRQTTEGRVLWTNPEYSRLKDALGAAPISTGHGHIFGDQIDLGGDPKRLQRAKLDIPGEDDLRWFEFQITWAKDETLLIAAIPVDRVVRAERSLSGFVQTLTQTFAHLNVGLAVFNRTRELAIFNPALTELFELSPEFLATRPSLYQVFDRLREQRMVPEPKDYKSWRRKMSALEAAASDTDHSETWSLVDGRTFRVTGRPHPEGAVAFLFEDISNEISLERRFRTELKMGHAVIDGLDEAIAVFTPSGALALSNRAYDQLWRDGAPRSNESDSFIEATRLWQHRCHPTPIWGDARDFAATIGERTNWTSEVRMIDGRTLECRFEALSGGYTLVGFTDVAIVSIPRNLPAHAAAALTA